MVSGLVGAGAGEDDRCRVPPTDERNEKLRSERSSDQHTGLKLPLLPASQSALPLLVLAVASGLPSASALRLISGPWSPAAAAPARPHVAFAVS